VPDCESAFVHEPMVVTAEQHEVADIRLAAASSVLDVMRADDSPVATVRKPAAAIA
jgi:hypothetical protein